MAEVRKLWGRATLRSVTLDTDIKKSQACNVFCTNSSRYIQVKMRQELWKKLTIEKND